MDGKWNGHFSKEDMEMANKHMKDAVHYQVLEKRKPKLW